jgi:hypothetical protein
MASLQIPDTAEGGFPVLLQLRGDEAVVGIAGSVATLGEFGLVARLLHFHIQDALLVFLSFPVHSLCLERGIDRHGFHRLQ